MYLLKLLENSFHSLNVRVKAELFLLPLLLIFLIWNLFFKIESIEEEYLVSRADISNLKMKDTLIKIIEDIEKFCKENAILIKEIKTQNRVLKIVVEAPLKEQLYFIKYIEDYNIFSKINLLKQNKKKLFLEIVFDKLYLKPKIELKSRIEKLDERLNSFILFAIVNKKAYINKRWLSLNQSIESYKLIEINSNSVVLSNKYKKIVLRLYKNENI